MELWHHVLYPDIRSLIRECLAQEEDWASLASLRMTCWQENRETDQWFNHQPITRHWIIASRHFQFPAQAHWSILQWIKSNGLRIKSSDAAICIRWNGVSLKSVRFFWYKPRQGESYIVRLQRPRSRFMACAKSKGHWNLMSWGHGQAGYATIKCEYSNVLTEGKQHEFISSLDPRVRETATLLEYLLFEKRRVDFLVNFTFVQEGTQIEVHRQGKPLLNIRIANSRDYSLVIRPMANELFRYFQQPPHVRYCHGDKLFDVLFLLLWK